MGLQAVVTGSRVRYNRDFSPTKLSFAYAQTIVRLYANANIKNSHDTSKERQEYTKKEEVVEKKPGSRRKFLGTRDTTPYLCTNKIIHANKN